MTVAQVAAIGALEGSSQEHLCTGLLIADRWVLSARHCNAFFGLLFRSSVGTATRRVSTSYEHPERDVALFELEPDVSGSAAEPIALRSGPLGDEWLQATVTLSGVGKTEDGSAGQLLFVQEPIIEIGEHHVVVDGQGTRGACAGDSGGPLLATGVQGHLESIGVLSDGSAECVGLDRYERVDGVHEWIEATMQAAAQDPCRGYSYEGTCELDGPRWCEGDYIRNEICQYGDSCGWSSEAAGYRCIAESDEPCRGIGPRGACEGTVLLRCKQGVLVSVDCAACGQSCAAVGEGDAQCGN